MWKNLEELHGPAELEVVVGVIVVGQGAEDLYAQLVQRVIVAAAHAQRQPGIATADAPVHAHSLGHLQVGLLLFFVLHLEQHALALQFQDG